MPAAPVQKANSNSWFSSSTTAVATFVTQNTAAAALYWAAIFWSGGVTITGIADTESNTWAVIGSPIVDVGSGFSLQLAYAKNVAGGSKPTVTVTFSAATSNRDLAIHEASGCDTTAPLDGHTDGANTVAGGGTDTISTGVFTTTANGDFLASAMASGAQSGQTVAAGTGYTLQVSDNGHSEMFATESQIQTSSSASTVGLFSPGGFSVVIVTAASFKAATGGGSRGLFRTPPMSGLGGGGSFFRDPLAAPMQMVRRDRIFVPAWLGEAA